MHSKFYFGTVKKMIVVFSTLFDEIHIDTEGRDILIPLHYSAKDKFVEIIHKASDPRQGLTDVALPVMGYEMTGLNFSPERNTNPINKMAVDSVDGSHKMYSYNRVPYELNFELYIATKRFEDSLKIVEQILPYFAPEFTVKVRDNEILNLETNVTITLNSASYNIDYEGDFDANRIIEWNLSFTLKSYFYSRVQDHAKIKNVIINFTDEVLNNKFAQIQATSLEDGSIIEKHIDPYDNDGG